MFIMINGTKIVNVDKISYIDISKDKQSVSLYLVDGSNLLFSQSHDDFNDVDKFIEALFNQIELLYNQNDIIDEYGRQLIVSPANSNKDSNPKQNSEDNLDINKYLMDDDFDSIRDDHKCSWCDFSFGLLIIAIIFAFIVVYLYHL